jgi:sulfite oxidase
MNASRRDFLRVAGAVGFGGAFDRWQIAWGAEAGLPAGKELKVRSADPLNAEPELPALAASGITPTKHFYVRNHGPMPKVEARDFKVRVEGLVRKPLDLAVSAIAERYRQQTATATLTCAGNRRLEMSAIKPVAGVQWDAGAVGTARWTGATLAEILRAAELQEDAKHVWFEGLDSIQEKDGSIGHFGGSIPIGKAMVVEGEAFVVHRMNDQPLTAEHGFPLRMVVPGLIGARSVKWLTKIVVSDRTSPNHYVAGAYKLVQTDSKDEMAAAEPIYNYPINAAICTPAAGAKLKAGKNTVSGYALPAGQPDCIIEKVELSRDGGRNWIKARLIDEAKPFACQLWTAELDLAPGKQELIVCATDTRGNMTPEHVAWNLKGYLYNAWHRVNVEVA